MESIVAARHAMNTRFEIIAHGEDEPSLRAAAEAALDEVERLESRITRHRCDSEIALVNREAWHHPVRVSSHVFELLEHARLMWEESGGVFDPTIWPLVEYWRQAVLEGKTPHPTELEHIVRSIGMEKVELRKADHTVRFTAPGMVIDLGGIGKGYAIDCAAGLLRENNVTSAFIHGGTSSAHGIGSPPDQDAWMVGISNPTRPLLESEPTAKFLSVIALHDESLGVSAIPSFAPGCEADKIARVVNPLTPAPAVATVLAAVVAKSATAADALSTAVLAGGERCFARLSLTKPDCSFLLASRPSPDHPLQVLHSGHAFSGQTVKQQ